jgi:hypothetical protein
MDTRTLIDHYNLLASITQSMHMEQQRQRHILSDLQHAFTVESRITSSFIVERLFNMERSLRRIEENLLPEAPKPQAPSSLKSVLMFSVSSKAANAFPLWLPYPRLPQPFLLMITLLAMPWRHEAPHGVN